MLSAVEKGLFAPKVLYPTMESISVHGGTLAELIRTTERKMFGRQEQGTLHERGDRLDLGVRTFDPPVKDSQPDWSPFQEHSSPPSLGFATDDVVMEPPLAGLMDDGH
jgi:hypothetical protein